MIEWKQRVQKLRRFDVETTQKNPRGELIDISSILKVESTSKYPRQIDVIISTWIRLSKSMEFPRTFHVEFRRRIDGESTKMCPLGYCFGLNPRARRKHLAIQLLWVSARLLVTRVSLIYLKDEFCFLFLIQPNEQRRLGESKVSSSCFWCLSGGMRK